MRYRNKTGKTCRTSYPVWTGFSSSSTAGEPALTSLALFQCHFVTSSLRLKCYHPSILISFVSFNLYPTVVIQRVWVAGVENKIFIWVLAALDTVSLFMRSDTLSARFLTYSRVIFGSILIFNLNIV